jgi:hypothetical protein
MLPPVLFSVVVLPADFLIVFHICLLLKVHAFLLDYRDKQQDLSAPEAFDGAQFHFGDHFFLLLHRLILSCYLPHHPFILISRRHHLRHILHHYHYRHRDCHYNRHHHHRRQFLSFFLLLKLLLSYCLPSC